jgi:hypothetical protein
MASALPGTKGARVAPFVPHATPAAERAIEPDSWEIRAEGVSRLEGQERPRCAFVWGKRIAEPTLRSGRWFLSGCYPKAMSPSARSKIRYSTFRNWPNGLAGSPS